MIPRVDAAYLHNPYTQNVPFAKNRTAGTVAVAQNSRSISVKIPGPNCIYSGGDGVGQNAYVEYTEDSTVDDPIVRISGHSLSGDYDRIVHINDIDPRNATYPELCALLGHQQKIGNYRPEHGLILAVPCDVDKGDYSQRQNFMQKISSSVQHNQQYGNLSMAFSGEQLIAIYQKFMEKQIQPTNEYKTDFMLDYIGRMRVKY